MKRKALLVSDDRDLFDENSLTFDERKQDLEAQNIVEMRKIQAERSSTFSRWTQYNNDHTKEMMWLALKHPKAQAILWFLVDQMDNHNAVMCSYQVLQEVLGVSPETIRRNIKVLKDNGYIAVLKSGTSNIYAINDQVYWKSWGNQKKYSKFPANIILSLSEQDQVYQSKVNYMYLKELEIQKKE